MPISPVVPPPVGRRRRPSGEPPPLPHHVPRMLPWYAAALGITAAVMVALMIRPTLARISALDDRVVRAVASLRTAWLDAVATDLSRLLSGPITIGLAWATIAILLITRRFRHLVTYLVIWLTVAVGVSGLARAVGRPRPFGTPIIGDWFGYSAPSRPVTLLAVVLVGVVYCVLPAGRWRRRVALMSMAVLVLVGATRIYLALDAPTDVLTAALLGWAFPGLVYLLVTPDDAFPVTYGPREGAHLNVAGERGAAIVRALDHQLGLDVTGLEPFGLAGSAGSTPLKLRCRSGSGETRLLFGKLYALNHLRSDRWYKLARTVLYGRLEDEKPFSTVRRLVMYEDHLLRLLHDAGLPSPRPYGVVEITPEREYLVVMEFFAGASEIGQVKLTDEEIDSGLRIVRQLWESGVAHRDLKPSNLLVRDGSVLLIDVAFAELRPTPWRQAVDLADMMLTLALSSDADRVYARALRQFAADDVAEAFAATRGVTLPTQLRARLRLDGRDVIGRFRQLAPPRRPVPVQLWSAKRVAATAGLVLLAATLCAGMVGYVRAAGLVQGATDSAVTTFACDSPARLVVAAQSVPEATYLPCVDRLPRGWTVTRSTARDGSAQMSLVSDREPDRPVKVSLSRGCDTTGATPTTPRAVAALTSIRLQRISPRYVGTLTDVFPGGCVTYHFDFDRGPHIALMEDLQSAVRLYSRLQLQQWVSDRWHQELEP